MNNENGAALLARVKPGDLVTIRNPAGGFMTGRAYDDRAPGSAHTWAIRSPGLRCIVTADNIVKVEPVC